MPMRLARCMNVRMHVFFYRCCNTRRKCEHKRQAQQLAHALLSSHVPSTCSSNIVFQLYSRSLLCLLNNGLTIVFPQFVPSQIASQLYSRSVACLLIVECCAYTRALLFVECIRQGSLTTFKETSDCFLFCVLLRVPSCICCSNRLRAVSFCTLREFLAMPPTARMTPDEKRSARDTHKRGFIPKHIADHLGRSRIDASRMGM